jgi:hypothetical protein
VALLPLCSVLVPYVVGPRVLTRKITVSLCAHTTSCAPPTLRVCLCDRCFSGYHHLVKQTPDVIRHLQELVQQTLGHIEVSECTLMSPSGGWLQCFGFAFCAVSRSAASLCARDTLALGVAHLCGCTHLSSRSAAHNLMLVLPLIAMRAAAV